MSDLDLERLRGIAQHHKQEGRSAVGMALGALIATLGAGWYFTITATLYAAYHLWRYTGYEERVRLKEET